MHIIKEPAVDSDAGTESESDAVAGYEQTRTHTNKQPNNQTSKHKTQNKQTTIRTHKTHIHTYIHTYIQATACDEESEKSDNDAPADDVAAKDASILELLRNGTDAAIKEANKHIHTCIIHT